jgi:predicted membrane chloride channel (bestrophin family)
MAAEILLKHLLPGSFNTTIGDDSSVYRVAFGICSFALSLLLASRVNNVVIRFNEARAAFEKLGNVCVVIMQVLATSCDDDEILQDVARWCVVYHNSVRKYLEGNLKLDEDDTDNDIDLNSFLHEDEVDLMHDTHKMRQTAFLKIC